jgi:phage-related protein
MIPIRYISNMSNGGEPGPKPVLFLEDEVKTPPFSLEARREVGQLLRLVQDGFPVGMPHSRPMPSIGPRCHELRVRDGEHNWRVLYRIDDEAILVPVVFAKKTRVTPKRIIDLCKRRLKDYDEG